MASLANLFHLSALFLISLPLSPSNISLMQFSIASLLTIPFSSALAFSPIFHTSIMYLALVLLSCVTKQPIASCAKTSNSPLIEISKSSLQIFLTIFNE
ncbi:hypothetical protein ACOSQ4_002884 [Xanthoceras sorbifolium]